MTSPGQGLLAGVSRGLTCPSSSQSRVTGPRNWRALQDMRRYRHHYPDLVDLDCNGDMPNLSFYRNEIRFLPDGCFIEDILQNWRGNYELLEDNHSYIQWLFPLREPGVNWHAKPLTLREVEEDLPRSLSGLGSGGGRCRQVYGGPAERPWALSLLLAFPAVGELGQVRGALAQPPGFVWGPHDKLRRFGAGAAPHQPAGPKQAMGEETSEDRLREARPQGRTRDDEDGDDEDGDDEDGESGGSPLPSRKLPGMGTLERRQGDEAGALGEDEGEPPSPKESKKRKLEAGRREQASGEPGPQSTFDVEKIALNLQGCALSQGSQALREGEQPCPLPPRTRVTDELRKRRRVDEGVGDGAGGVASGHAQAPAPTQPPAPAGSPEAGEDEGRIEDPGRIEAPGGQAEPEQGDAQSLAAGPSPAGPAAEGAEAAEPAEPAEPAGVGPPANPRKP
ncbi:Opioid growth factor receptor [Tupaia chinensis]|uniref:Opioid growth factor receptor n=1 Tax=Tupaia chinensis TaxID=246437 RepID=L8Y4X6_TUPCH|nr:Opioid growth factor receptor [Tupaia chinensis]